MGKCVLLILVALGSLGSHAEPWNLRVLLVRKGGVILEDAKVFIRKTGEPRVRPEAGPGGVCSFAEAGSYRIDVFAKRQTTQIRDVTLQGRNQTIVIETQPHFAVDPGASGTGRIRVLLERREGAGKSNRWVRIVSLLDSAGWDGAAAETDAVSGRLPSGSYMVLAIEGAEVKYCAIVHHNELMATTVDLLDLRQAGGPGGGGRFGAAGCKQIRTVQKE